MAPFRLCCWLFPTRPAPRPLSAQLLAFLGIAYRALGFACLAALVAATWVSVRLTRTWPVHGLACLTWGGFLVLVFTAPGVHAGARVLALYVSVALGAAALWFRRVRPAWATHPDRLWSPGPTARRWLPSGLVTAGLLAVVFWLVFCQKVFVPAGGEGFNHPQVTFWVGLLIGPGLLVAGLVASPRRAPRRGRTNPAAPRLAGQPRAGWNERNGRDPGRCAPCSIWPCSFSPPRPPPEG